MATDSQKQQTTTAPNEPVPVPLLPFEMKATLKGYWPRVGIFRFILGFALTFIIYARGGFLAWLLSVIAIVILLTVILLCLSKRSITATEEGLEFKNAFGAKRSIIYSDISVARLFIGYVETGGFGVMPRIIISSNEGTPFASIYALYWPPEKMESLLALLNERKVKVEAYDTVVNSAMIAKQFPDAVSYYEKHPYIIAIGIVIALLIVITVGVLLYR